ncbi:MBL fold metallo-hydrolase [Rugosimonospora africana]|uniref:MBL fold hydrolase n=1 Tax=Rugosimonospora africana TaxID=556532 RepID=A0A8J3VQL0_9ACTN|nr:MBL fold metallo-hydrolase [Rugosimonospora africana]GIH14443.1 MBL fold hydrolase [Rugosimonospora africana]
MIEITGVRQVRAWRDRVMPPVERLSPGLWSIPVPLPDTPLRYVLVYLLELPSGVAIIDAGWDNDEAWQALLAGIVETGHAITDVRAVLVTHVHPDHYGLGARVREASGAWIGMHVQEAASLPRRIGSADGMAANLLRWLRRCGAPEAEVPELLSTPERYASLLGMPEPDRLLADGDKADLPTWDLRAVWTPGHTAGHLCFYEPTRSLLFSGDHVLPRISPNISVHATAAPNPLGAFLRSLAAVGELPVDEVLPAHEYRFRGLPDRVDDLRAHHDKRLAQLTALVADRPGQTTWQLAAGMTWSRDWSQLRGFIRRSAVGETLAHLVLLEHRRALIRSGTMPDRWALSR